MIVNLMLGTVIGVAIALAYGTVFTSPLALMIGMAIAATGALAGAAGSHRARPGRDGRIHHPADATGRHRNLRHIARSFERVVDIALGCGFAVLALGLNGMAQHAERPAKS